MEKVNAILHFIGEWLIMALWRFFDYITENGQNLMQGWYDAQDPEVQAQFDATLLFLAGTADWEHEEVEEFKPLTERPLGLGEVRFYVDWRAPGARKPRRRRFRPVGIWPPQPTGSSF